MRTRAGDLLLLAAVAGIGAARPSGSAARLPTARRALLRALSVPPPDADSPEESRGAPLAFGDGVRRAASSALTLGLGSGKALDKSLSRLPAAAQYNVVLQGTLARRAPPSEALALIDEMSRARIRVAPEAVAALFDAQAESDVGAMARAFDALARNPAGSAYGYCAAALDRPPIARGGRRERVLAGYEQPPTDSRATDGALLAAVVVLGAALLGDELVATLLPHAGLFAPSPALVGAFGAGSLLLDRYSNQGDAAATLARAASRVGGANLQREAAADAAAFVVGYALGLPWCTLEPRASRVSSAAILGLAAAAGEGGGTADGERCVDRTLVWLLAPAAAEAAEFGSEQLRVSEPSQARALLTLLRGSAGSGGSAELLADGGWVEAEDEQRIAWAYAQAARLLRQLAPAVQSLRSAMEEGGLTPGRAIVAIEQALR